jgi:hypothetical protein
MVVVAVVIAVVPGEGADDAEVGGILVLSMCGDRELEEAWQAVSARKTASASRLNHNLLYDISQFIAD